MCPTVSNCKVPNTNDTTTYINANWVTSWDGTNKHAYASRAVQFHPNGGQYDFVWPSARTMHPHGGATYVWCLAA